MDCGYCAQGDSSTPLRVCASAVLVLALLAGGCGSATVRHDGSLPCADTIVKGFQPVAGRSHVLALEVPGRCEESGGVSVKHWDDRPSKNRPNLGHVTPERKSAGWSTDRLVADFDPWAEPMVREAWCDEDTGYRFCCDKAPKGGIQLQVFFRGDNKPYFQDVSEHFLTKYLAMVNEDSQRCAKRTGENAARDARRDEARVAETFRPTVETPDPIGQPPVRSGRRMSGTQAQPTSATATMPSASSEPPDNGNDVLYKCSFQIASGQVTTVQKKALRKECKKYEGKLYRFELAYLDDVTSGKKANVRFIWDADDGGQETVWADVVFAKPVAAALERGAFVAFTGRLASCVGRADSAQIDRAELAE